MISVLLASENPGKLAEISEILAGLPLQVVLPSSLGVRLDVAEEGKSYAENAAIKALTYCAASGMLSLGDDSGLEVEALGGLPGLHSRRFLNSPGATDADRRRRLLELLAGKERPWKALFRCSLALATPDRRIIFAEGKCAGEIIPKERGTGGFGYDPIFLVAGTPHTMAELTMEEKNRISHRARALLALRPVLAKLAQG